MKLWKHIEGQGLDFDMKYNILHVFIASTAFKEKSSNHFKDIYKLNLLTNFDLNMTSFLRGVPNYASNV